MKKTLLIIFLLTPVFGLAQSEDKDLEVRVDPPYFSPNGDGIQDQMFFSPILITEKDVTRWRLVIVNEKNKKVFRTTGAGFSALIKWDGKDKKGEDLPDGDYSGQLTIWGEGLKVRSHSPTIVIDTQPPLVEMTVSTNVLDKNVIGQDILVFTSDVLDESPVDRWQFQVLDLTGRTVYVEWSTSPIKEIQWGGIDQKTGVYVPQGIYRCALQAWDVAGNESEPFFVDVYVNVTAREMLEAVLQYVGPIETDLGLILQLSARDIFDYPDNKPVPSPQGVEILKEVALIINAYPKVNVRLDGYSKALKSSNRDRSRSSIYAWSVYSFLVKKGNVKASRLSVRGRGRSPMFERRQLDLPLIRNGIEVILEGNREW